mmetsp:Transcript_64862/g.142217  ORF Transcript_64862/g.142217 Transcript_64862/m.142217 type:complete len:225 (+) Transcript_64862:522-1196(+)
MRTPGGSVLSVDVAAQGGIQQLGTQGIHQVKHGLDVHSRKAGHSGSNHGSLLAQMPFEGLQEIQGSREWPAHGAVHQHNVSVLPGTKQGQANFEGTHIESGVVPVNVAHVLWQVGQINRRATAGGIHKNKIHVQRTFASNHLTYEELHISPVSMLDRIWRPSAPLLIPRVAKRQDHRRPRRRPRRLRVRRELQPLVGRRAQRRGRWAEGEGGRFVSTSSPQQDI